MAETHRGVAVAYLHPGQVAGEFCRSLTNLVLAYPGLITGHMAVAAGANISRARNEVVEAFLDSTCEWLWMVDSDMTFEIEALEGLLAVADPDERPVVGGLCFAAHRVESGYRLAPTIYDIRPDGLARFDSYPENTALRVGATGAAMLVVHRTVFERFPESNEPLRWFRESIVDGRLRGEDITFCAQLRDLDIPIYVHTGVKTGHVKTTVLDEELYRWQSQTAMQPSTN